MTVSSAPVVVVAESEALGPVRQALLALARRDARAVVAEAEADASATLAEAARQAEQIRADARSEAATDAAALLAAERSRINREARATELRARREAYDDLVRRAREAARGLSDEPGVQDRLLALAREDLGPVATVLPSPDGGVIARLGARQVSYSLTALADEAVADLLSSRYEP